MAAYMGKNEIMEMIAPSGKVYQAGTYSGNPISVVAGLATLKILLGRGRAFYAEMKEKCEAIVRPLKKVIGESNLKMQISHIASMFQVFFTIDSLHDYRTAKTADNVKFMAYQAKLLENKVFVPPSQFETCFLSSEHSSKDIKHTVETATRMLTEQGNPES
jgi:glutamate-1-semialdehyde 2,1-aminomutase